MIVYSLNDLEGEKIMKKKTYLLGHKVCVLLTLPCFLGHMAFATVPSTSESQREAMSDSVFEALVKGIEEKQKRQEAVSAILNENKVVGVVFKKDDGSVCQVSGQENLGSYIPRFMSAGDSLEDFGLPECGEEELAVLEQTAPVAAVEDGPSQANVAVAGAAVAAVRGLAKLRSSLGLAGSFSLGGTVLSSAGYCVAGGVQATADAEKEKANAFTLRDADSERQAAEFKMMISAVIIGLGLGMTGGFSKKLGRNFLGRSLASLGGGFTGLFVGAFAFPYIYFSCESGATYFLDSDGASVDSDNTSVDSATLK